MGKLALPLSADSPEEEVPGKHERTMTKLRHEEVDDCYLLVDVEQLL